MARDGRAGGGRTGERGLGHRGMGHRRMVGSSGRPNGRVDRGRRAGRAAAQALPYRFSPPCELGRTNDPDESLFPPCRRRARAGHRPLPRDGGADGRARARGGRAQRRPPGDRRARLPDAAAGGRRGAGGAGRRATSTTRPRWACPQLREAIARHYADRYGVDIEPERVIVTAGSSAALLLVMALLVDRDERILMSDPGYPCNRHFVRVLEGEPVGIPVGADTRYQLSAALIERALDRGHARRADRVAVESHRHRSPAGRNGAHRRHRRAARRPAGRRRDLPRPHLRRQRRARCSTSPAPLADDLFVVSSFSKYFNMTGWRLGWIIAPERHVRDLEKLAQNLYISPATVSQHAALACFRPDTLALLEERRREFAARRDLLVPALRQLGFGIPVTPSGGFFVYADSSRFAADSAARSAATCWRRPASRSRRASTSARTARTRTSASPTPSPATSSRTDWRGWRATSAAGEQGTHRASGPRWPRSPRCGRCWSPGAGSPTRRSSTGRAPPARPT